MKKLAQAILIAAELREKSWSTITETYTKTMARYANDAAEAVGFDERGSQPIYLLLKYTWNDTLNWAKLFKKD